MPGQLIAAPPDFHALDAPPGPPALQLAEGPAAGRAGPFYALGRLIGRHLRIALLLNLLLLLPLVGLAWLRVEDNIRDGYTPRDAPSRVESRVLREFYNTTSEPVLTVFLMTAKDGGSLLRTPHLGEIVGIQKFLKNEFEANLHGYKYNYAELCAPYCFINKPLELFHNAILNQWSLHESNEELSQDTDLKYPQATVNGIRVPLQMVLYDVKLKKEGGNYTEPAQVLSNMESANVIMLIFRGDVSTPRKEELLANWEMEVFDYTYKNFKSDLIQLDTIGVKVLDHELIKDGERLTPFFAVGFTMVGLFVSVAIFAPDYDHCEKDRNRLLLILGALCCPSFAILHAFGAMTLLHLRVNSFLLVMPTLVFGIGVDDGFLLIHSWTRHNQLPPRKRIAPVLADVGPSMTITTVTNVLSFGIGCMTPTKEIQLFCFGTALALLVVYLFHFVLFCPLMIIADLNKWSDARAEDKTPRIPPTQSEWICRATNIMAKPAVFSSVLLLMLAYWALAFYGLSRIEPKLDAAKILPQSSRIQAPNRILHDIVWRDYQAMNVFVITPFNLSDARQRYRLDQLVYEFESLPHTLGPESTMLWLRDYEQYFYKDFDIFDVLFGDIAELEEDTNMNGTERRALDESKLKSFLNSPLYQHWKGFMRMDENFKITKFWFSVAYSHIVDWSSKINLVQECRKIATKFPDLNVTVWEQNGNAMFVDQMLGLKKVALQTTILTWACMAVVCAVFIRNMGIVLVASLSISSICVGVIGILSVLGFDLDPVTVAALLMSIGLSVDYTAHTSSHFQRHRLHTANTVECVQKTLDSVAWPMMQSALSTILCVSPLYFSFAYTTLVFFSTICLVTVLGLLHGLVVVPCVLLALGCVVGEARFASVRKAGGKKTNAAQSRKKELEAINGPESDIEQVKYPNQTT